MRVNTARAAAAIVGCGHGAGKEKNRKRFKISTQADGGAAGEEAALRKDSLNPASGADPADSVVRNGARGRMLRIANTITPVVE
jgi:hypothetical protein